MKEVDIALFGAGFTCLQRQNIEPVAAIRDLNPNDPERNVDHDFL